MLTPFGRRIVVDAGSGAAWVAPIALARRIVRAQSLAAGGVDDESMGRRGLGAEWCHLGREVCYGVLYGEESDDHAQATDARS